ncbi:MAG TPA: ABC transporter permease, partial [Thermoanaerobaculia bacterium]
CGAERGVLGQRVSVDGVPTTVVGVLRPGFAIGNRTPDVVQPLALGPLNPQQRGSHFLDVIGRLRPGATVEAARAELLGLLDRWPKDLPKTHTPNLTSHRLVVSRLLDDVVGEARPALRLLAGAVAFLLLIACANLANLLLARAEARQREISIRTALGADRGRLLRQFLTESVLLALLAGAVGLLLAMWGVDAILASHLASIPRAGEIGVDFASLVFALVTAIATGLLFGLAPALHARTGAFFAALKEGGQRATVGSARQRLRRALVVGEVAAAAVLVIGGGLLIRSFWALQQVDPGFRPDGVLSFKLSLPATTYPDPTQAVGFYQRLVERLGALPGVTSAAAMSGLPPKRDVNANDMQFESIPPDPNGPPQNVDYWQFVTRDYFKTLGIGLAAGRLFLPTDGQGTPGVVLINETMAKVFWPDKNPIGQRIRASGPPANPRPWMTVVGIVKDVKQGGLDKKTGTEVYFLHAQAPDAAGGGPTTMNLALRTERDPLTLAVAARGAVRELDPALAVADEKPLPEVLAGTLARPRFITLLVILFAVVALILAAVGTYGVLAYSVEQRTREIGVRMALGAQVGSVLGLVLRQGALLVLVGLGVGLTLALALGKLLAAVLFGVTPTDPTTLAGVSTLLLAVAFLACYLPARRAAQVDPLTALRAE